MVSDVFDTNIEKMKQICFYSAASNHTDVAQWGRLIV